MVLFWLSDAAWMAIEPHLPKNHPGARRVDASDNTALRGHDRSAPIAHKIARRAGHVGGCRLAGLARAVDQVCQTLLPPAIGRRRRAHIVQGIEDYSRGLVGDPLRRAGVVGVVADVHTIPDARPQKRRKVAAGDHPRLVRVRLGISAQNLTRFDDDRAVEICPSTMSKTPTTNAE